MLKSFTLLLFLKEIGLFTIHCPLACSKGGEGWERSPMPYFENGKRCLEFRKKYPVCIPLWVKFSFKMLFKGCLRVKTPNVFPAGLFFCIVYMKRLTKCLYCKKSLLFQQYPGCVSGLL